MVVRGNLRNTDAEPNILDVQRMLNLVVGKSDNIWDLTGNLPFTCNLSGSENNDISILDVQRLLNHVVGKEVPEGQESWISDIENEYENSEGILYICDSKYLTDKKRLESLRINQMYRTYTLIVNGDMTYDEIKEKVDSTYLSNNNLKYILILGENEEVPSFMRTFEKPEETTETNVNVTSAPSDISYGIIDNKYNIITGRLTPGDKYFRLDQTDPNDELKKQYIKNQTDKILYIENFIDGIINGTNTVNLREKWCNSVLGIASDDFGDIEGQLLGIDNLSDDQFMRGELDRLYNSRLNSNTRELYDGSSIPEEKNHNDDGGDPIFQELISEINNNYGQILYVGHSEENELETTRFQSKYSLQLKNENPFLFIGVGCSTGSFDETTMSISESFQCQETGSYTCFAATNRMAWETGQYFLRKYVNMISRNVSEIPNDNNNEEDKVYTNGELFKKGVTLDQFSDTVNGTRNNDFYYFNILGDPVTKNMYTIPEYWNSTKSSNPEPEPEPEPEELPEPEPEPQPENYDVVIVGGGASGVIAAYNIAINKPDKSILLLERNSNTLDDYKNEGYDNIYNWTAAQNDDRYMYLFDSEDNKSVWLGKGLGGGTLHFGLQYVDQDNIINKNYSSWKNDFDMVGNITQAKAYSYPIQNASYDELKNRLDSENNVELYNNKIYSTNLNESNRLLLGDLLSNLTNITIKYNVVIDDIVYDLNNSNTVSHVRCFSNNLYYGRDFIICSGAIQTPAILQRSNIDCGNNLYDHGGFSIVYNKINSTNNETINVYVGEGSFGSPYYNFYSDSSGMNEIDAPTLDISKTYVFTRLDNAGSSHPFYIGVGSRFSDSNKISLTGDGTGNAGGIQPNQSITLTFDSLETSDILIYYCTVPNHSGMVAQINLIDSSNSFVEDLGFEPSSIIPHLQTRDTELTWQVYYSVISSLENSLILTYALSTDIPNDGTVKIENNNNTNPNVTLNYFGNNDSFKQTAINRLLDAYEKNNTIMNNLGYEHNSLISVDGTYVENNINSIYHYHGSCAIGDVVNDELKVNGKTNLYIGDISVLNNSWGGSTSVPAMVTGYKVSKNFYTPKILALHGGGQNVESFQQQQGVQDLMSSLSDYEFYFPSSPLENGVWIQDPPEGKDFPTDEEDWANSSINYLDGYIQENGPFEGIIGYSQGVPMTLLYLAKRSPLISKIGLYCGYLPTTHNGLMSVINNYDYSNYAPLIFLGVNDTDFYNIGLEIKNLFSNYLQVTDSNTGHELPVSEADTYETTVDYYTQPLPSDGEIYPEPSSNLNNNPFILNLNYTDNSLKEYIDWAKEIISSIILSSNIDGSYDIDVIYDDTLEPSVLGYASLYERIIALNRNYAGSTIRYINDNAVHVFDATILHETLHMLGLVGFGHEYVLRGEEGTPKYVYIGENGIEGYKEVLSANNFSTDGIIYVPLEDDFDSGTRKYHWEEGIHENYQYEYRYINGVFYPAVENEIMSGFLDSSSYITPMTVGALEDIGYVVNYNSENVVKVGNSLSILDDPR